MAPVFSIASTLSIVAFTLLTGAIIGYPATALFDDDVRARLMIAPAIGLALFGVVAALIFQVLPLNNATLALLIGAAALCAYGLLRRPSRPLFRSRERPSAVWFVAAALLATIPAYANAPHAIGDSIGLGETIFDHAKVAIVDEIARNGLPAHNPFFAQAGSGDLLNYYYLWYLLAAIGAVATGATGWEADVALTGVTAFVSLTTLAWLAVAWSGRSAAAWWVLAFAFASTLRFAAALVGGTWLRDHMARLHLLEAWTEQASWVPQHVFAATLALLVIVGLARLLEQPRDTRAASVIVGALLAASYDSSIWIGGFGLAAILPPLAIFGLATRPKEERWPAIQNLSLVVVAALVFAAVFLARNLAIVGQRKALALWSYPVLLDHGSIGGLVANELAFWFVLLPLDLGLAFPLSLAWLAESGKQRRSQRGLIAPALALALLVPALMAQHVQSVIANNDFGWRIVLIAIFATIVIAAASLPRWLDSRRWRLPLCAGIVALLLPGMASAAVFALRFTQVVAGDLPLDEGHRFLGERDLWAAVRAVTPKDQAILNNPDDLAKLTKWPGNIGWALLSNRRSCDAGDQWLSSLAPQLLPEARQQLDAVVRKVFDGKGSADDLRLLKQNYLCSTLVVVPSDGAWGSPLFAENPYYKLVGERDGRWRLYR